MMGRHHVAVAGSLSAVAAAWCYRNGLGGVADLPTVGAFVAVGAGAGLAPDVDEPGSSAPRTFGWLGMGVCRLIRLVVRKHRGATHTVEMLAGTCALLWWASGSHPLVLPIACGLAVAVGVDTVRGVSSMWALAVGAAVGWWVLSTVASGEWWPVAAIAVGWFAHLLSDTPTPHGVPWTLLVLLFDWPYVSLRLFRTGTWQESVVTDVAVLSLAFIAWKISGVSVQIIVNRITATLY